MSVDSQSSTKARWNSHPENFPYLPLITVVVAFVTLLVFVPFGFGYGQSQKSIGRLVWTVASNNEEWLHCLFVPFISLGIVWYERKRILAAPRYPVWWMVFPAIGLGLIYWAGMVVDLVYLGEFAVQALLGVFLIMAYGWHFFGRVFFPWAFLAFAWPLPFLEGQLALKLRFVMSEVAYTVLSAVGIPTTMKGTAIMSAPDAMVNLPAGAKFAVDVANPCSGLNSLFALVMVSTLYGYFTMPGIWRKVAMVLLAIPLAIIGNVARIMLLTFGTILFGSEFAIGTEADPTWFHLFAGFFVFIVAIGGMILCGWLLTRNYAEWFHSAKNLLQAAPAADAGGADAGRAASSTTASAAARSHEDPY